MNWKQCRKDLLGNESFELPPEFKLPILPQAVSEFNRASNDEDVTIDQLAHILETDSGLTIEVLKMVNSSIYGFRSKISSVKQAINMLGIPRTKTSVLTMAVKQAMSGCQSKLINLKHFWAANMERAIFAKEMATLLNTDGEIAYAASMLQDFMLPVLTSSMFEQYTDFVDQNEKERIILTAYEQKKLGWDHAVAAAHITHKWEFPDDLICSLYLHHKGLAILMDPAYAKTPAAAVALSALLPDAMQQSPQGFKQLIQLQSIWKSFDLPAVAQRVEEQFYEMGGDRVHHLTLKRRLEKHQKEVENEVAVCM